jgi:enoyl-[acyl-carrier protein] reductase I
MIPGSKDLLKNTAERNPFKRATTPEDVADVVYLLCKNESGWINGTIIKADGGESIR